VTTGAEETGLATAAYEVAAEESCVITALAAAGGGRGAVSKNKEITILTLFFNQEKLFPRFCMA
jgi:hypothetical protein